MTIHIDIQKVDESDLKIQDSELIKWAKTPLEHFDETGELTLRICSKDEIHQLRPLHCPTYVYGWVPDQKYISRTWLEFNEMKNDIYITLLFTHPVNRWLATQVALSVFNVLNEPFSVDVLPLTICLRDQFILPSFFPFFHCSFCLSNHLSVLPSRPSIIQFVIPLMCPSSHPSVRPAILQSVTLFMRPSPHLSARHVHHEYC